VGIADYAAEWDDLATRAEAELAITAVRAGAQDLLTVMRIVTPKRTGHLMESEKVLDVSGDGAHAIALVGPDGTVIYDEFRNDGGTITAKRFPQLGNPDVGWFGKQVTQEGAHYMEKAEEEGRPVVESAMQAAVGEFFTLE
jgi:hypothetical protein